MFNLLDLERDLRRKAMWEVGPGGSLNRTGWPAGPWLEEPDRIEFWHAGRPCLMQRNELGAWCGYAGVGPGHPWHGLGCDEVDVTAHGGLSWAAVGEDLVRHQTGSGSARTWWWFGFDCARGFDLVPYEIWWLSVIGRPAPNRKLYRDAAQVRRLVEQLAGQLAAVEVNPHA